MAATYGVTKHPTFGDSYAVEYEDGWPARCYGALTVAEIGELEDNPESIRDLLDNQPDQLQLLADADWMETWHESPEQLGEK